MNKADNGFNYHCKWENLDFFASFQAAKIVQLLNHVTNLIQNKKYTQALNLLQQLPADIKNHSEIHKILNSIFVEFINKLRTSAQYYIKSQNAQGYSLSQLDQVQVFELLKPVFILASQYQITAGIELYEAILRSTVMTDTQAGAIKTRVDIKMLEAKYSALKGKLTSTIKLSEIENRLIFRNFVFEHNLNHFTYWQQHVEYDDGVIVKRYNERGIATTFTIPYFIKFVLELYKNQEFTWQEKVNTLINVCAGESKNFPEIDVSFFSDQEEVSKVRVAAKKLKSVDEAFENIKSNITLAVR